MASFPQKLLTFIGNQKRLTSSSQSMFGLGFRVIQYW